MAIEYLEKPEETEGLLHCPTCSRDTGQHLPHRAPRRQPRYWIITSILHLTAFLIVLAIANIFNRNGGLKDSPPKLTLTSSKPVDHNAHLIGTSLDSLRVLVDNDGTEQLPTLFLLAPLNHHEQVNLESVSADYADASLWFGEPIYDSDRAWNKLIYCNFIPVSHYTIDTIKPTSLALKSFLQLPIAYVKMANATN